jgi:hypothetical protein
LELQSTFLQQYTRREGSFKLCQGNRGIYIVFSGTRLGGEEPELAKHLSLLVVCKLAKPPTTIILRHQSLR